MSENILKLGKLQQKDMKERTYIQKSMVTYILKHKGHLF